MVGEILHGTFTLKNNSEIDLQYGISMLSEKSEVVQAFSGPSEIGTLNLEPLSFYLHNPNLPGIIENCKGISFYPMTFASSAECLY